MDKRESNDNKIIKRPMYVETEEIQSRLPELLLCLLDGEMMVIRHRGKNIGYLMPRDEEREQELRELDKAAAKRLREGLEKLRKTRVTREEIVEPAQSHE